jgi:hypothetical protein
VLAGLFRLSPGSSASGRASARHPAERPGGVRERRARSRGVREASGRLNHARLLAMSYPGRSGAVISGGGGVTGPTAAARVATCASVASRAAPEVAARAGPGDARWRHGRESPQHAGSRPLGPPMAAGRPRPRLRGPPSGWPAGRPTAGRPTAGRPTVGRTRARGPGGPPREPRGGRPARWLRRRRGRPARPPARSPRRPRSGRHRRRRRPSGSSPLPCGRRACSSAGPNLVTPVPHDIAQYMRNNRGGFRRARSGTGGSHARPGRRRDVAGRGSPQPKSSQCSPAIGRTSTVPYQALGCLDAISMASSRSEQSITS